jgi:hypothetical protein
LQDPIGRKTRPQRKSAGSFYKLKITGPNREEDQAREKICREFLHDREPTLISHFMTDGDSAAFRGDERVMAEHGQVVESLRDTPHLAQSQKAVDNATFNEETFPGRTAAERLAIQRKFFVDVMKRCTAEYDTAVKKYGGDTEKLINTSIYTADAVLQCYWGTNQFCTTYIFNKDITHM